MSLKRRHLFTQRSCRLKKLPVIRHLFRRNDSAKPGSDSSLTARRFSHIFLFEANNKRVPPCGGPRLFSLDGALSAKHFSNPRAGGVQVAVTQYRQEIRPFFPHFFHIYKPRFSVMSDPAGPASLDGTPPRR